MSTDADSLRARIADLLAGLPDPSDSSVDIDIDAMAARLEEAHDVLVRALESVDRGPAGGHPAAPGYGG
jgi:hypothetical protein